MSPQFTAADRLVLLAARDVFITLTESGDLSVKGPAVVVDAARPMIKKYKPELVRELRRLQETMS